MVLPHEITLIAYTSNEDGTISIADIVETSLRYAPSFARGFRRHGGLVYIAAIAPNAPLSSAILRRL